MTFEHWLFWWAYNRDAFLDEKTFPGNGASPLDAARVTGEIVLALEKAIRNEKLHPAVRGSAEIALARAVGEAAIPVLLDRAKRSDSAVLALALAPSTDPKPVRDFLIRMADDGSLPHRSRSFALIALGLLGDRSPEAIACIERRLDGSEIVVGVPVAALTALGLVGDPATVPKMLAWLDAGRIGGWKFTDLERSHLVQALGRTGDPSALGAVVETLRRRGLYTRRSAMIALGRLVPRMPAADQLTLVKDLARFTRNEEDDSARNFGLVSLGRIGGHTGASEPVREACVKVLVSRYEKGNNLTERPFAALALGLAGRDGAGGARQTLADLVRADLQKLRGDQAALGANAVALGLLADDRDVTVSLLLRLLADRGLDLHLRGAAATGLALIGRADAADSVIKALADRLDRNLRVELARAGGLLGGPRATKPLLKVLNDWKASQHVLGSAAQALGRIRDPGAVAPLVAILEAGAADGRHPDLTRMMAATALGLLCERREGRVLHRLSTDCNYRASVPMLDDLLTIR